MMPVETFVELLDHDGVEVRVERLGKRWRVWTHEEEAPVWLLWANITDGELVSLGDDPASYTAVLCRWIAS